MTRNKRPRGGWEALVGEIIRGTPRLEKALCRGQTYLFDVSDDDQIERENCELEAKRMCARCPELEPCTRWVDSLPLSQRPGGVVAGHGPASAKGAA